MTIKTKGAQIKVERGWIECYVPRLENSFDNVNLKNKILISLKN